MSTKTVLYDLGVLVKDNLGSDTEKLAELLGRGEHEVRQAIDASLPRYRHGEITQGQHWDQVAERLGLLDTEVLAAHTLNTSSIDQTLLGRVRVQAGKFTIGVVSDATPDWVGHWRREYELDRLFAASIIDSELDEQHSYAQLLKLGSTRLQATPEQTWFVDTTPGHQAAALELGMPVINPSGDHKAAFSVLE